MSKTLITAGQSLLDVAIQELGSVAALFDLADAAGLGITDALTPGQLLAVPTSPAAAPALAAYFADRAQRINTGGPIAPRQPITTHDFDARDFNYPDFDAR
ncbi:hypothetical protein [Hymenobacter nivis]|uniref:LysM domain-containing protein n=1 Tax=Hymenobacter nivis TaxID=1850093 RepID=A0A2Z3GI31_9BACT|nr:hypothetical protein [Hymenobacter nivis]AWM31367.1 hypothetical protein DDQ68_00330 [Hymenobacter nivis]